jgi:hypothetical protein
MGNEQHPKDQSFIFFHPKYSETTWDHNFWHANSILGIKKILCIFFENMILFQLLHLFVLIIQNSMVSLTIRLLIKETVNT